MSHHKKSRNTIKQNPEDVEWNRNETPRNYPLESHEVFNWICCFSRWLNTAARCTYSTTNGADNCAWRGASLYHTMDLQFPNRSVTMCQTSADRLQLACLLACLLAYLLTYMGTSSSGPVWAKQERVHDHSRLLQQFLGHWPPHKYHLISCSFEAEEPFCSLWLP